MTNPKPLLVRAIKTIQAGTPVYTFFLPGASLLEVADICRMTRSTEGLDGFQRGPIQKHIAAMVDYLDGGNVLFPNAVLLALSPRAKFARSRGPTPAGLVQAGESGVLKLPAMSDGSKCAWIVDGQQRSTALARARNGTLPVPVVAFASDDIQIHRQQFILVNKARPLPKRLVDELLPEVDVSLLPADMAMRKIPSALVDKLDADEGSPFFGLIRRSSNARDPGRVVTDTALVNTLHRQIHNPLGALASFRSIDGRATNPNAMYEVVVQFWWEVKRSFPDAWGLPAEQSRLMHSAGISAIGALMDYLMPRALQCPAPADFFGRMLRAIAPECAWTGGRWTDIDCAWNQVESTAKGIRNLSEQLIRLTRAGGVRQVA